MEIALIAGVLSLPYGWLGGNLAIRAHAEAEDTGYGLSVYTLPFIMFCLWLIAVFTFGQGGVSAIIGGGGIIGAVFGLAHGGRQVEKLRAGKERKAEAHTEDQMAKKSSMGPGSTVARPPTTKSRPKSTTARSPTTESRYVPIATGADWDNYYGKLIDLHGCGPGTAQRIMSKVLADQDLTDHERNLWQQVQ
jgi:hypothetical protein